MEAKMHKKQLKHLAQEMEQCGQKLSSHIRRLDDLCESRYSQPLEKKLRAQSSFLKKQAGLCRDLAAVLEQTGYLYEKAEESIIQAAEADAGKQEEILRAVSLADMARIPVSLR